MDRMLASALRFAATSRIVSIAAFALALLIAFGSPTSAATGAPAAVAFGAQLGNAISGGTSFVGISVPGVQAKK